MSFIQLKGFNACTTGNPIFMKKNLELVLKGVLGL